MKIHPTPIAAMTALLALACAPALADEPPPTGAEAPYSPYYTGAFVSLGAFAGPSLTRTGGLDDSWSTSWGAWAQMSVPLQIVDVQVAYYRNDSINDGLEGDRLEIGQDTLSVSAGLHPFFLSHLESTLPFTILGGTYLLLGVDLDRVTARRPGVKEIDELDLGLQLGGGLDFPLDDTDDGGALWLGLQYRYNSFEFDTAPLNDTVIDQHLFFIRLSYRKNGLLLAI